MNLKLMQIDSGVRLAGLREQQILAALRMTTHRFENGNCYWLAAVPLEVHGRWMGQETARMAAL